MKEIKIHPTSFKIQLARLLIALALALIFIFPVMDNLLHDTKDGNPTVAAVFLLIAFALFCLAVHFAFKLHRSTH